MKKDLAGVIRKVSAFLGKPISEDKVKILADHCSFDKMKNNKAVNKEQYLQVS